MLFSVLLLFGNNITSYSLNIITDGTSKGVKGTPLCSYVVMGLQESPRAPGWYNGYVNKVYEESDWNYILAEQLCEQDLKSEINRKFGEPAASVAFFSQKIASQWCEPAFQGFWYNREDYQSVIKRSEIYYELTSSSGRLNRIIYMGLDAFQSLMYLGILFYIAFDKRKVIFHDIGLIIFCGGFLFHMFWEGKSSYAFPYFVIIIPYAVSGIAKLFDYISECQTKKTQGILEDYCSKKKIIRELVALVLITCLWFGVKEFRPVEDTEDWNEYVRIHRFVPDGAYNFESAAQDSVSFPFYLKFYADKDWIYELKETEAGENLLITDNESLIMKDIDLNEAENYFGWRIERLNGGYCFRWYENPDQVLTYDTDEKNLCLCSYEENNMNQIWNLRN